MITQEELRKCGINIIPYRDFENFDEAIAYVKANPERYVIKPSGASGAVKRRLFVGDEDDGEDVIRVLEAYKKSFPDEIKQFPIAALGWVHYKRKEFEKAVDFLSKSSELGASSTTLTHLGMALLASGEEDRARSVLAHARNLGGRAEGVEEKMMEFMKDSTRLLERVRRGQKK